MAGFSGKFRKLSVPIIIATLLITVVLLGNLATSPPSFNTDLDAFTPDSDAKTAHERIHENFPNETRPMFIDCLLYTSPSPRDATLSRMPSSA